MLMQDIVVLDYFINKNLTILEVPQEIAEMLTHGDRISYLVEEKGIEKESIGIVIGYPLKVERTARFLKKLTPSECEDFLLQQELACKIFPVFKKKFKASFPNSKPITARYNPITDQIYFYFYSEERYHFAEFVKELRADIGKNIFLFQV